MHKLGDPASNSIKDMLWTTFSLKIWKQNGQSWSTCSSQWPTCRYGIWHCPMPWCTTTPSLVILHQIA